MAHSANEQVDASSPSDGVSSDCTAGAAPILCPHCKRTADNGIRCLGMCVADSDY